MKYSNFLLKTVSYTKRKMAIVRLLVEVIKSQLIIPMISSEPNKKWPAKMKVINVQVNNAEHAQNKKER